MEIFEYKLRKGHIQFNLTLFIRGFVLKPKLVILHRHRFNCLILAPICLRHATAHDLDAVHYTISDNLQEAGHKTFCLRLNSRC